MRIETAFEKRIDAIFVAMVGLSTFFYLMQAYLKKRHPLSFSHIERFVTYFSWMMMPYAVYQLFLYFSYADTAKRLLIAFFALIVLIGLAARWWNFQSNSASDQP